MKVCELAAILAHLPPDAEVHLLTWGHGAMHVGAVSRLPAGRTFRFGAGRYPAGSPIPAGVRLHGEVRWDEPEPAFTIRGPIRDRRGLDAALDAMDPVAT